MRNLATIAACSMVIVSQSVATAGPCLQVALVGAVGGPPSGDDIMDRLMATGRIESIEPTSLLYLDQDIYSHIDALFVIYLAPPQGSEFPVEEQHGDMIVELIEAGRGVLMVHGGLAFGSGPWGEFRNHYLPLGGDLMCPYGGDGDSMELPQEDPLFAGVTEVSSGQHTRVFCESGAITPHPNATIHAYWPNSQPLAASMGNVVAVNVTGISDEAGYIGYPAGADFPNLFVNALYLSTGNDPATACNGDEDDDGLLDEDENRIGTDWENPDTDTDGALDGFDVCPLTPDAEQSDTDGDGVGDACDDDADNDGIADDEDNCVQWPNPTQQDVDADGVGDDCQFDSDADGVPDPFDNCLNRANADQSDTDADSIGDACEADSDGDGIIDDLDNCVDDPNPEQDDRDDDGIGDVCERGVIGCTTSQGPNVAWLIPSLLLGYRRRR